MAAHADVIGDLKSESVRLTMLLEDPYPGLITWNEMLIRRLKAIMKIGTNLGIEVSED